MRNKVDETSLRFARRNCASLLRLPGERDFVEGSELPPATWSTWSACLIDERLPAEGSDGTDSYEICQFAFCVFQKICDLFSAAGSGLRPSRRPGFGCVPERVFFFGPRTGKRNGCVKNSLAKLNCLGGISGTLRADLFLRDAIKLEGSRLLRRVMRGGLASHRGTPDKVQ